MIRVKPQALPPARRGRVWIAQRLAQADCALASVWRKQQRDVECKERRHVR
jgi:hypothetical protein